MDDQYTNNSGNGVNSVPSVYKRGAEDGLWMGLLLSVAFLTDASSLQIPLLALVSLGLKIAVPVMAYIWLKRDFLRYPTMRFFSALWMHGISFFFFGSLICAVVMFVYLRFIYPDFIIDTVHQAIDAYNAIDVPSAHEFADSLQHIIDMHALPSPITLAVTQIWAVTFGGSILTMILAFFVRLFNRKKI